MTKESGRPRIIDQLWNDEIKKKVLEGYAIGLGDTEAICTIGIGKEKFYQLMNGRGQKGYEDYEPSEKEILFMDTIKEGRLKAQKFLEREVLAEATGIQYNKDIVNRDVGAKRSAAMLIYTMNNRFRKGGFDGSWNNKQEIEQTGEPVQTNVNITADLFKQAKDLNKKLDDN